MVVAVAVGRHKSPQHTHDERVELATALHQGIDPGAPGERYQVVLHVDAGVLADAEDPGHSVLEDGARVCAETSQARGGPTTLSNLALLCRRHHRAVHEEGYAMAREADGTLTFRRPNGWSIPDVPEPPWLPIDPMDVLKYANLAMGVEVDAQTMTPAWYGERLDVAYAIDVLHPLALAARPNR